MTGSTDLKKLIFTPGFNKNTTKYNAENYWVDGDKVRFRSGNAQKIGGWVKETLHRSTVLNALFTGVARAVHAWTSLEGKKYFVQGSHKKVELMYGNEIFDITPIRESNTLNNAISTTDGSPLVNIEDTTHNLEVGDYVFINSQASAVGGITLAGEYTVTTVVDFDNFEVTASTNANATTSSAGGDLEIDYLLQNGEADNGNLIGYSGGTYGTEGAAGNGYGLERAGVGGLDLRQWSFDNWGEDLVACVRDGKVYRWIEDDGVGERLAPIPNAPVRNLIAMVAQPSRHLVLFGSEKADSSGFDPLVIRWSEQELWENWTITPTNTAGEYRIPLGNTIVSTVQTRSEILILTDNTAYTMRSVSGNDIFQFNMVGGNTSAASQHCSIEVNGTVYWMGVDNFYRYDGVVKPMRCTLTQFIFDQDGGGRINAEQKEKVFCATNKEFNEIIWFYPSYNSTENDRYVIYNYMDDLWYDGSMQRTVWLDRSVFSKPYAMNPDGNLYVHEVGKDDDANPMDSYIESGYMDIQDGTELTFVDRIVPDFNLIPNRQAELYVKTKKYPNGPETVKGPFIFNNDTQKISVRARGRQVSIRYEVSVIGADFEVGAPRIGIQTDGGR